MLYPRPTATRDRFELDGIWDLARELDDPAGYPHGFEPEKHVAVPGSFNDLYTEEAFRSWQAGIWYQKRFTAPRSLTGQRCMLRFGAVNYRARVHLNGTCLGSHETGYTPFEFDITDTLRIGEENLLCVRVENQLSADTVPQGNLQARRETGQITGQYPNTGFDFYPYAGIHRPVCLYTTDPDASLDRIRIDTDLHDTTGIIDLKATIRGTCARAVATVVETGRRIELTGTDPATGTLHIDQVRPWDIGQPNLYHLRIELFDGDGRLLDQYTERFGVRSIRIEGNRLLLNGRPVYLQGFGKHEDFPILGKGLNHAVNVRDFELMRWIGANSFRTTHYPYAEETIDLADQYGFLVIAEAPAVSINLDFTTDRTLETHLHALTELIERDRNHPCVIMWSVANEANADRPGARPYFQALVDRCRELDPGRPVTAATCFHLRDTTVDLFDVISINTYPGWYLLPGQIDQAVAHLHEELDSLYRKHRKPIFISEFGADTIAGYHALPAEQWTEDYQVDLILALIDVMRQKDFVIGEHLWNFADFRTAQNHTRVFGNKKGIFTRERQPKMIARFLRDRWAGNGD